MHTRITACHCSAAAEPLAFPITPSWQHWISNIFIYYWSTISSHCHQAQFVLLFAPPEHEYIFSVRTTHHRPTPKGFQPYWKASKAGLNLARMVWQSKTSRIWQCLRREGHSLSATFFTLMLWTTQDVSDKVRSKIPYFWIYTRFALMAFGRYSGRPVSPSSSHSINNIIIILSQLPMHSPAVLHPTFWRHVCRMVDET